MDMNIDRSSTHAWVWQRIEGLPVVRALPPRGMAYLHSALAAASKGVGASAVVCVDGVPWPCAATRQGPDDDHAAATFVLRCLFENMPLLLARPPAMDVGDPDGQCDAAAWHRRPDYLCVTATSVRLVEVGSLANLEQMRARRPADWHVDQDEWTYLPGAQAARRMGMEHDVFYPESLAPRYVDNLRYLVAVRKSDGPAVSARTVRCIQKALLARPRAIGELVSQYVGITADDLVQLLASKKIHALLDCQAIDTDLVVFGSESQRDRNRAEIADAAISGIPPGGLLHRLACATPKELAHAYKSLHRYNERRRLNRPMDSRDYRNRKAIRAAIAEGAPPVAGLVPRFSDRGGKGTPLAHAESIDLGDFIEAYLDRIDQVPSASRIRALLMEEWSGTGRRIPCAETIRKYLARRFRTEERTRVPASIPPVAQPGNRAHGEWGEALPDARVRVLSTGVLELNSHAPRNMRGGAGDLTPGRSVPAAGRGTCEDRPGAGRRDERQPGDLPGTRWARGGSGNR